MTFLNSETQRLFIALDVGADVRARIEGLLRELKPLAPKAKWVGVEGLHVTLAFLGEVSSAQSDVLVRSLAEIAARHSPFAIHIRGGGTFGSHVRPLVLWIDLDAPQLAALQADVAAEVCRQGHVLEERPFRAHLTLARARAEGGDASLAVCGAALQACDLGSTLAHELILFRTERGIGGASYSPIARAPLG